MPNYNVQPIDNFSLREMTCKCRCGLVIVQMQLLKSLDAVRKDCDQPIIVRSWTRCKNHNKRVGGKRNSYHLYGKAVDIVPERGMSDSFIYTCRRHFPFVEVKETFCHCDIRGKRSLY